MADHAFEIIRHDDAGWLRYEGPHGPLLCRYAPERGVGWLPGIEITGGAVGCATFTWESARTADWEKPTWQHELEHGIAATVDEIAIRFHRPKKGLTRAGRAIHVERPDATRHFRMRGLNTFSLETESGTALVRERGLGPDGTVSDGADLLDVVTMLLLVRSGLGNAAKSPFF